MSSIFTKIINRELPANIRYEDDDFIAFDDIYPSAPIHILVVPKREYETLESIDEADEKAHAKLLIVGRKVAKLMGIGENYRMAINVGKDVQAVLHVHLHVLGGWTDIKKAKEHKF